MQSKNRLMGIFIAFIMVITCVIPHKGIYLYASGQITISEIKQGTAKLQRGDTFTLTLNTESTYIDVKGEPNVEVFLYELLDNISVTGSAVEQSPITYKITSKDSDPAVIEGKVKIESIVISGLKYTGIGNKVIISLSTLDNKYGSDSKEFTLDCMTIDETKDAFKVDDTTNILVKTGVTQNTQIKVINQGKQTLRNIKVQLELGEKVEGIKIKTEEASISQLQPKEVKTAAFSIEVGAEVKAQVYKANVIINGASFPVNLQVDSNVVPSVLEVVTDSTKIFNPGVTQDAVFVIKNVGDRPAKNIRVEVNAENIAIMGGSNVKHIAVINAKSNSEVSMTLRVDGKVNQSSIPLKVDMSYLNSLGEEVKDTQYVYLSTSASSASSEVVIDNVLAPLGSYGVDQNFTVKFNVSSKGGAENLKISVKGDEGIVPKSQNLFFVTKLGAGEKKQYAVTFAATRTAVSSTHPIEIAVEYGGGTTPTIISQYSSVNISNPEKEEKEDNDGKKGMPKVIIGHYKSEPVVVRAGEQFDLEIGFLNAHKTEMVHNLKANLAVRESGEKNTGSVFTPVGASNTFYIADLLPGQTDVKKIRLYTIPSASPKTYEITIEMEYEDSKGNEIKAMENIGIPVEQTTKIEIGDIQTDFAQVGMPAYFNATIYNTGKTEISNMMIHIEGEGFTVQDNKMFIGTFEKGATENYAPMIIADMPGNLTGNIIIEYEEATGEHKVITKEFTIEVAEMYMPTDMPMDDPSMMPQPSAPKLPLIIGILFGMTIALIVTAVVLKKRKVKKEMMMLDEDD